MLREIFVKNGLLWEGWSQLKDEPGFYVPKRDTDYQNETNSIIYGICTTAVKTEPYHKNNKNSQDQIVSLDRSSEDIGKALTKLMDYITKPLVESIIPTIMCYFILDGTHKTNIVMCQAGQIFDPLTSLKYRSEDGDDIRRLASLHMDLWVTYFAYLMQLMTFT